MIENGKNRHTVWLTDEAWNMVGGEYKADGCSTQNEYIEKAIRFYTGYRKTDRNERYLTDAISGMLENDWVRWVTAWENCYAKWQWRSP